MYMHEHRVSPEENKHTHTHTHKQHTHMQYSDGADGPAKRRDFGGGMGHVSRAGARHAASAPCE